MATMADLTPQKFSKLIKTYYGIPYIEFLNRLKIHNFLTHFNHFNQYTLETYIYESGYSNRSTFYAAFKKYVGVNPSFYLKEVKV
jgi:AraC-like DNA-binding protein